MAIVARTMKGWGAAAEQGTGKHGTPVKKDKLQTVFDELDKTAKDLGVAEFQERRRAEDHPAEAKRRRAVDGKKSITRRPVCRRRWRQSGSTRI